MSAKSCTGFCLGGFILVIFLPSGQVRAETSSLPSTNSSVSGDLSGFNEKSLRSNTGKATFTLMGRRYDDPMVNSRWGRFIFGLELESRYQNWLQGNLDVAVIQTSGMSATNLGVTEAGPASFIGLNEASLKLMPTSFASTKAGILRINMNPIFSQFYEQNWAGALAQLESKGDATSVSLTGSQSIPTSKDNSNKLSDENTTPLLTVGNLLGTIKVEGTGTTLRASASHFEFTDLSVSAASDAQKTGSSTVGVGKTGIQYLYEFRGKEYAVGLEQRIGLLTQINLKASMVKNELAPESFNTGKQYKVELLRSFNRVDVIPSYIQFRMESDALPSSYSLAGVGYTNRVGYALGLKLDFFRDKFNIFGGYTNAKVLNSEPSLVSAATYQGDREVYTLGAEAKYDLF
jgi:hypothetical protein